MYNDTIKVANKIITSNDLLEIFAKMEEKLIYWQRIYSNEEIQNRVLDYKYQNWSFKDTCSKLEFNVNFYDDTSIKFDNYNNFILIFNSRLDEIKSIYLSFGLNYFVINENQEYESYHQYINMNIYEDNMNIDVSLSSYDKKIDDIYDLIKNKILNAPQKYDYVIKKKNFITTIVNFAIGFIPSLVISTLLLFFPIIRNIFAISYILYPICCLVLAYLIGELVGSAKIDQLYKNIMPEKKYVGYDTTNYKSIYKDDIDKYIETSEILIGKNTNNLQSRKLIVQYKDKYKKFIPYEIGIMIIISIIVIFLK